MRACSELSPSAPEQIGLARDMNSYDPVVTKQPFYRRHHRLPKARSTPATMFKLRSTLSKHIRFRSNTMRYDTMQHIYVRSKADEMASLI